VLVAERRPQRMDDYIAAGRAMQRFWLTATAQGLQLQPE
jgi:nitroreductase